jgi:hypothetical protein
MHCPKRYVTVILITLATGFLLAITRTFVTENNCPVGWVDIGTVARVPLNVVVYLKKVGKMT